jgi:hypothetical protein
MPIRKVKGLSANDRSAEDKKQIELQGTDYKESVQTDSLKVPKVSASYTPTPISALPAIESYNKALSAGYKDIKSQYEEDYHVDQPWASYEKVERDIKEVAYKISPYYRKYSGTDYITFTPNDWAKIYADYNARKDVYGEQQANEWLQGQIQDNVANNQGVLEKYGNAFLGLGASTAGALVSVFGNLVGGAKYLAGEGYETEGLNGWQNFVNNVMDNEITRYGDDIVKYGSWRPEQIKRSKTLYGGISNIPILATEKQQREIFNVNTIPEALAQGGFTAATMLMGAGEAEIASWAFRGIKKATLAAKAGKTLDNLSDAKKALSAIQKVEKATYAIALPAIAGTHEGLIEGLNTKLSVLENSKRELAQQQEYYITNRAKQLIAENPSMDYESARDIAFREYGSKYEESLEYIEAMASKAGINNFYANSAINGVLNASLKAGLQAPTVQSALQKSKLTSWAFPSGQFNATGTPGNVRVTPKFNKAKQVFNVGKELSGELTEEYLQSISDAAMSGAGEYSISKFIENKYNGESVAEIGDYMSGSFAAGWTALTESLTDKETIKAGVYGAISSALGTFGPSRSTTKLDANGNVVYKRNPDGSLVRDKRGRPIAETVRFSRGQNAKGELESRWEAFSRAMPWRSGLYSQIKATRNETERLNKDAGLIEDWINDPKNQDKFDGAVGTASWVRDMSSSASISDEFGYRNSVLGKTINDAVMLEKLKGTAFYDSYMNNLVVAANAEEGTQEATNIINSIRQNANISSEFESMTDSEVLSRIKDNANKMLNTINTIQTESDNIERVLGNVDEDTKISLIYGKMALDDWNKRKPQLDAEINEIATNIQNTVEQSNLTPKQKEAIATFGSFRRRQKEVEEMKAVMESLEKDIKNLESRQGNIKSEKEILKLKRAKYNSLKKAIQRFSEETEDHSAVDNTVLNESEILSLPSDIRAAMLNPDNLSNYSEAQQEVIKNIINKGTAQDINFSSKMQDSGRLESASRAYLTQYNSILTDPQAFNNYVARQREAASDVISKKRYESLSQITDYVQFARELDKIYDTSTKREQALIESALRRNNNENFARYEQQRTSLNNLVRQILEDEYFNDMDENDVNLFMHTLTYLSDRGVDISNSDAGSQVLMEQDAQGNFLFESYVNDVNSNVPEDDRVEFTSIGQVIQTYVDALNRNNKDNAEREKVEQPIVVEETPVEEDKPAEPVEVTVEEATPEIVEESTPVEEVKLDSPQGETVTVTENTTINTANNLANNLPRFSKNARGIAQSIINNASVDSNPTILAEYLNTEANRLSISSANTSDFEAADLLRQIATRVSNLEGKSVKETITEEKQPSIFDQSKSKANVNAMESLDMNYITNTYPNGALSRFYKKYKIAEFLRSDVLAKNSPIVFISDPQLASEVREEMEASGKNYTLNALPIVAAVEVESGGITIGDKQYQPIAIMPATDNQTHSGAARLSNVRKSAYRQSDETQVSLIKDENGEVITTSMYGNVVAKAPNHLSATEPNRSVHTLQTNDLESEERETLTSLPKSERRKSPIYRRLKNNFLSRLKVVNGQLVYEVPNLKGEVIPISAFVTPVQRTVDRNSDKTIAELFNENDPSVLNANSRLNRAAKTLVSFFKNNFNTEDFTFEQLEDGSIFPTEQTIAQLNEYSKQLGRRLGNFLNLPSRQGWEYTITPTDEMIGNRRLFELAIVDNDGNRIVLGNVTSGIMPESTQMNILKNIIMDESGNVRMRDSKNSFVIWNVNYNDVGNEETTAKNNMSDIYDDDIIDFSKDSLEYTIKGVVINAPFTLAGESNYYKAKVQNTKQVNNPAIEMPEGSTIKEGNSVVDTDTGAVVEGNTSNSNNTSVQSVKEESNSEKEPAKNENNTVNSTASLKPDMSLGISTEMQQIKDKAIADGTFMKAPNGESTNLKERQWLQVRTKAFKDWFGDWINPKWIDKIILDEDILDPAKMWVDGSDVINENNKFYYVDDFNTKLEITEEQFNKFKKGEKVVLKSEKRIIKVKDNDYSKVLDENGEPLVLYHRSDTNINKFDISKSNHGGFWFSTDPDYYFDTKAKKKYAIPVFLNIRTPNKINHQTFLNAIDGDENIEGGLINFDGWITYDQHNPEFEGDEYEERIVFAMATEPEQIKSATDNVGTFSKENDNIYDRVRQTEVKEAKEQEPVRPKIDRRRKKESITKPKVDKTIPKVDKTIPDKFKWGVFEGANMSVNEITEALNARGITTEEQWNNRTYKEMERELHCCGAL